MASSVASAPSLPLLQLSCAVQSYAWGKRGASSEVARLKASVDAGFAVREDEPYAELWMGTHAKGPSVISHPPHLQGMPLSSWLEHNPQALLGKKEAAAQRLFNNNQLPFLFKVLSINKSLSIQAHPNKQHAALLHSQAPDKYPDSNHKPELAISLTSFEGFCGFRPFEEIRGFVSSVSELRAVVGEENAAAMLSVAVGKEGGEEGKEGEGEGEGGGGEGGGGGGGGLEEEQREALRKVFSGLMSCDKRKVEEQLNHLVERTKNNSTASLPPSSTSTLQQQHRHQQESSLLLRLWGQFPGDVGCFCVFFLNYLQLQPGEAIYLAPNEPHAYLSGDVVECMACSDNVVRAGLTPKFIDRETLCSMLTYSMKEACQNKFPSKELPAFPYMQIYDPPIPEFAVARVAIPARSKDLPLQTIGGPSILLVIEGPLDICTGDGTHMTAQKGAVVFVPAEREVFLSGTGLLFHAYCCL